MKSLLVLVLLINVLGYLMMTNIPPSSTVDSPILHNKEDNLFLENQPATLVLIAELPSEKRASLTALTSEPGTAEGLAQTLCDVVGPFADKQSATAVLIALLPDLVSAEELILESSSAEFWLSIPASASAGSSLNRWPIIETKKRYLEDCMKVASGLKFH